MDASGHHAYGGDFSAFRMTPRAVEKAPAYIGGVRLIISDGGDDMDDYVHLEKATAEEFRELARLATEAADALEEMDDE